jgi:hypothetical protein
MSFKVKFQLKVLGICEHCHIYYMNYSLDLITLIKFGHYIGMRRKTVH